MGYACEATREVGKRLLGVAAALALGHSAFGATLDTVLLGKLNCTACHVASEAQAAWISPRTSPRLNGIGDRTSATWLRRYLLSPHTTMPGTTMPDVLRGLPTVERAEVAEALTHFLLASEPGNFRKVMPDRAAVARGENLYHRIGCVACHAPQNTPSEALPSTPLPDITEKWSFEGLRRFLLDPLATRPSGRMPAMQLTDREAGDIAHYLLRDTKVSASLELTEYRGRMRSFDDFETAELSRTGPVTDFTLATMGQNRGYALRFTGGLRIRQAGDYTLHLTAVGASRLAADGRWIAGEGSWEAAQVEEKTTVRLEIGWHPVTVDYVQRGSKQPLLKVEWEGPGIARQLIPSSCLSSEPETAPQTAPFVVDNDQAAKGRELFAKLQCGRCHDATAPANSLPSLAQLRLDRGCLAETPNASAPDFHLEPAKLNALRMTLEELNHDNLPSPSPKQRLAHTLAAFHCTACHARDGGGGATAERDAFFTSNGEDLGDEGRLPPRLDGVGDKLRPEWLAKVLTQGASVRPYLNTRMPLFGAANMEPLTQLFIALDRRAQPLDSVSDGLDTQRAAGRRLVGTDGLSCIACHRFNRRPAHALQIIDLTTTTERLNEDWFRQFLLDPNRFHPGTRMPAFWPEGQSLIPDLLDGDTARQHAALWTYLADGSRAKFPEGLSRQNMELIVGGEAVLYRGKLWEAGFRAVAVGYPGQLNAAFDAEEMRLALLWRGRFLNAGAHWGIQGMGRIRPIGTDVIVFPHGPELATLKEPEAPWPVATGQTPEIRFHGYQLGPLKQPTLFYQVGGVSVEDFATPIEVRGNAGFRRSLRFSHPLPDGLHFRVAVGKLTAINSNTWDLNGSLELRVTGNVKPFVRGSSDQQELLTPVHVKNGTSQLEIEYVW